MRAQDNLPGLVDCVRCHSGIACSNSCWIGHLLFHSKQVNPGNFIRMLIPTCLAILIHSICVPSSSVHDYSNYFVYRNKSQSSTAVPTSSSSLQPTTTQHSSANNPSPKQFSESTEIAGSSTFSGSSNTFQTNTSHHRIESTTIQSNVTVHSATKFNNLESNRTNVTELTMNESKSMHSEDAKLAFSDSQVLEPGHLEWKSGESIGSSSELPPKLSKWSTTQHVSVSSSSGTSSDSYVDAYEPSPVPKGDKTKDETSGLSTPPEPNPLNPELLDQRETVSSTQNYKLESSFPLPLSSKFVFENTNLNYEPEPSSPVYDDPLEPGHLAFSRQPVLEPTLKTSRSDPNFDLLENSKVRNRPD